MTTTSYAAPARPVSSASSSRWLLWPPLVAIAAMAVLQCYGCVALSDGAPDLDPLYALGLLFVVLVAVGIALPVLLAAVVLSFTSPASRVVGSVLVSAWTALSGLGSVGYVWWAASTDPELVGSSTAGDEVAWFVGAGLVVVVPLVVVVALVVRLPRAGDPT